MSKSVSITIPEEVEKPKSLKEKIKAHYNRKLEPKSATAPRVMFFAHGVLLLYVIMKFVIPFALSKFDPWSIYLCKVFVTFLFINCIVNWMCVILYSSAMPITRDRPYLSKIMHDQPPDKFVPYLSQVANGHAGLNGLEVPPIEKDQAPWEFCSLCNIYIPPRTHHCDVCKRCILKRDHHCYLMGNCVGYYNQRYFIVLAFYVGFVGIVASYFNIQYLKAHYWKDTSYWEYFPPVTIFKSIFGDVPHEIAIMVTQMYLNFFFGPIGLFYFLAQMFLVIEGKTSYEIAKKIPVRSNNSVIDHFRSVFGGLWQLNFIFPAQILFRQPGDGTQWDGIKIGVAPKKENKNGVHIQ